MLLQKGKGKKISELADSINITLQKAPFDLLE